ncbi:MAG: tRNA lysidine(34) synthetase TilS [Pirellulales bacterium]
MLALEEKLARAWPPAGWRDVTVLVAVSGGPDSVALLRALAAIRGPGPGRLVAAHFNHRLRGADSDDDEQFVVSLCRQLGVELELGRADTSPPPPAVGDGLEAAARQARYAFLKAAAARRGARYVATAHTADDQALTILHRVLRGTGLAGLAGIPRVRRLSRGTALVRPLLTMRRQELLAYLEELGQTYRVDSSNLQTLHTRNRLRLELLPQLEQHYNPRVVEALVRLGTLAGEAQQVLEPMIESLTEQAVHAQRGRVVIDCSALAGQPRYLVREMFVVAWRGQGWPEQSMGFEQWERLAELAMTGATRREVKITLPGAIAAHKKGEQLTLARLEQD